MEKQARILGPLPGPHSPGTHPSTNSSWPMSTAFLIAWTCHSGQLSNVLGPHTTTIPQFATVEVDACVGPEFLFHNGVRFCGPARQPRGVNVIQESTQLLITKQPCLGLDEG